MEVSEIIAIIILVIAVVFFLGSIWMLICSQRTYNERVQIINWVFDQSGNWRQREQEYNRVSYDQHMWALITFRNPKDLYNFKELG